MVHSGEEKYQCSVGGSTFLIRIHFKQNSNWQGTIQWVEINQTISFRSVLELTLLINQAVENTYYQDDEHDFRAWHLEELEEKAAIK